MADDFGIKIQAELDEAASSAKINNQLDKLRTNPVKVDVEVDPNKVSDEINKAAKNTDTKIEIPFNFKIDNKTDQTQIINEINRLVSALTNSQGKLSNYKINTDGFNKAKSVLLEYKNEVNQTVTAMLGLEESSNKLADGTMQETSEWVVKSKTFSDNIAKTVQQQADQFNKIRDLLLKAENLKIKTPNNINLDYSLFDKAINEQNVKQAGVELDLLVQKYKNLSDTLAKDLPSNALENLPDRLGKASKNAEILINNLNGLKTRGGIIPDDLLQNAEKLKVDLQALSESKLDNESSVAQFRALRDELSKLQNQYAIVVSNFRTNKIDVGAKNVQTDVARIRQDLLNMKINWSAMTKDNTLVTAWDKLFQTIESGSVKTSTDVTTLRKNVYLLRAQVEGAGLAHKTWFGTLLDNVKKFSNWFLIGGGVASAVRSVREMFTAITDIDTAMVTLKKVTDETDVTYEKFLKNASVRAKELAVSISDLVSATADFARLGYSLEDATKLGEVATLYYNIGDGLTSVDDATEDLISSIKAFGIETDNAITIVDALNKVGNEFAISSGGIGEALQRSASALAEANNTIEQSIALNTAANNVVEYCHAA